MVEQRGTAIPTRASAGSSVRVLLVSPVRVYRDGLVAALARHMTCSVVGSVATVESALPPIRHRQVDVVLYDLRCAAGLVGLHRLASADVRVLAVGMEESDEWIIACAEAGIAGYVTDSDSLEELVARISDAALGRFTCPPHLAASLLHRIASIGPLLGSAETRARLTSRELDVAALLQEGLSNKQIASRLCIQLPTVKNHVHSILGKLETTTRGDAVAALRSGHLSPPRTSVSQAGR